MADPLSTVANILAILKLASAATQYLKDVKQGSTDRLRLRDELRSTTCLLEMLKDRIDDSEDAAEGDDANALEPSSIASLAGEDGPLASFRRILEEIIAKLAPQDRLRRYAQHVTWPFDKKEITELISSLERLKSHFSLVMQNDLVELAKLSHLKLDKIGKEVENARSRSLDKEAEKILLWLSPHVYRTRQLAILENVQPGTGTWFLSHATFGRWVKGEVDVLWCPGIPGAGKTCLASLVVDRLERENTSSSSVCVYIYCSYDRRDEQSPAALLSSILRQALQHSPTGTLPAEVLSLYQQHKKHSTRPTLTQLTDTLRVLTARFTTFHVVVDALDECAESDVEALRFVSAVRSLGSCVKLLCTSRFSTVFGNYFSSAEKIEISAKSEDIGIFLGAQIQQQPGLARHVRVEPSLRDEIIAAITAESHGMFLLARLHVDSISKKISRRAVRDALRTLPTTLDATYSEALTRIGNQAPELCEIGWSVLYWVLCAKRPLSVPELCHAYAMSELPGATPLADDDLPDAEILLSTCGGLIVVDAESQTVSLVHYTAQEYFERSHKYELEEARWDHTGIGLAYLALPNFADGPCADDVAMSRRLEQYPFLAYAGRYWGVDIGALSDARVKILWPKLMTFLSEPSTVDLASQVENLPRGRYAQWSQSYPRNVPALVLAAGFDMPKVLERLITVEGNPVDAKGSDRVTALIRAATFGFADNVRVLLRHGAEIGARDRLEETALHKAASGGAEAVVRILLDSGADVNGHSPNYYTILMSGVSSGKVEVVRMLIQAGAELGPQTPWGESALTIALRNGQEAIATLLADSGAVLPQTPIGRRASLIASRNGLSKLVGRLTADYEPVAAMPLRRQSSKVAGHLAEIRKEEQDSCTTNKSTLIDYLTNGKLPHTATDDEEDFAGSLEGLPWRAGFRKLFDMGKEIGKGSFATVYACRSTTTGVMHAVKVYRVGKWTRSSPKLHSLRNEVNFLQKLQEDSHPNILSMISLYPDYSQRRVCMVTELAAGGDLFTAIVKQVKLSEQQTRRVFRQLFSAVEFLHDRGWIHRDIKLENILLCRSDADSQDLTIKLADFGLVKQAPADSGLWHYQATLCGTPIYVAPETIRKDKSRRCGTPTDIWSCGVVMYICLCGFPPFSDELKRTDFPYGLAEQIRGAMFDYPSPYWDSVSDEALDLIDGMLVMDMVKRFNIKQCLQHRWLVEASPTVFEGGAGVRSVSPEFVEVQR